MLLSRRRVLPVLGVLTLVWALWSFFTVHTGRLDVGSGVPQRQVHSGDAFPRVDEARAEEEEFPVRRTVEEARAERERDGYLIGADSVHIRERARRLCGSCLSCSSAATVPKRGQNDPTASHNYGNAKRAHHSSYLQEQVAHKSIPDHDDADDDAGEQESTLFGWQHAYTKLHRAILAQHERRMRKTDPQSGRDGEGDDGGDKNDADGSELNGEAVPEEKYVVYECRGLCGGWGDRMYGLFNVFLFALVTDRAFLIKWDLPLPTKLNEDALTARQIDLLKRYGEEGKAMMKDLTNEELEDLASASYLTMLNDQRKHIRRKYGDGEGSSKAKPKSVKLPLNRLLEPINIDWRFRPKLVNDFIRQRHFTTLRTIDQPDSWAGTPIREIDVEADMFQHKKMVIWNSNNWYANALVKNERYRRKIMSLFGVDPLSFKDDLSFQTWTSTLYGCFINFLFRPVSHVRTIINAYSERMRRQGFTLGVQLRMGGSSVGWSDPKRNDKRDVQMFFRCARDLLYSNSTIGDSSMTIPSSHAGAAIAEPIRDLPAPAKAGDWSVFVISDSDSVKNDLLRELGSRAISVKLPIAHIDKGAKFEGYVTIAAETWLLGECDFIMSSRSNLGWWAGKRTLHDFGTYWTEKLCAYDRGLIKRGRIVYRYDSQ